jgi:hypothetical protein
MAFVVPSEHKAHLQLEATVHIHVSVVLVGRYSAPRVVLGRISDVQVPVWFAPIRV